MSPEQLQAATGCKILTAAQYAGPLNAAMKKYGINTPNRKAGFIGNIAIESGLFEVVCENLHYSAKRLMQVYPSRFPTLASTEGYVMNPAALSATVYGGYMGRGLIQLTGLKNYQAYAKASGVDVLGHPELLQEPEYAADSAGWYWSTAGCSALADKADWSGLTRRINGAAMLGNAERIAMIQRCLKLFI